jgi:glycosyltransferase involved in cell wall biosynthesis
MKVLLLTQVLPYPPDSGPKVKTYNVLKYLAQHHEVTLVSFVRGDQSKDVDQLRKFCAAIHVVQMQRGAVNDGLAMVRSLVTSQPWMMVRDDRTEMRALIDKLCAETKFDVAHADQLNMGQYAARVPNAKKVMDAHNALWLLYKRLAETMPVGPRRLLLERDWKLLKTYEGHMCNNFDVVLAVSEEDKRALLEAMGEKPSHASPTSLPMGEERQKITVIPIAVDGDETAPVHRHANANHILHIGTMYWPPNIDGVKWFINEVMPLIRDKKPGVVFDVVGARPPQALLDISKADPTINVTGYVDNPHPYLQQAGVMVVPLRAGGGMRVKILNAMAQALPIVTTTLGCEGIAVKDGTHVLIADTPADFAAAVLRVLDDRVLGDSLGHNGRALIDSVYDYRAACRPLEALYRAA